MNTQADKAEAVVEAATAKSKDVLGDASETIGTLAGRAVNAYEAKPAVVIAVAAAAVVGIALAIAAFSRK